MAEFQNYAEFVKALERQLAFKTPGGPANFQLHHLIPREILKPILEPNGRYTDARMC